MAKTDNIKEVDRRTGDVKQARKFDAKDWDHIAEYWIEEWSRRKKKREDVERRWDEIDRQIAMVPDVAFKRLPTGTTDANRRWPPETELPLQAQALEVLQTDARKLMFSAKWFKAHAKVTDEYLRQVEGHGGIKVLGDENYVPSTVNQDNADKLVEGFLSHCFRQYDHISHWDAINAEAFKYGVGVGRARLERKSVYTHESMGVMKEEKRTPVIVPCSIRQTYLDDPRPTMHSSTVLSQTHIAEDNIKYENIVLAANKGSNDPEDDDGGWMPKQLSKLRPEKNGYIRLLEVEGDVVIPRKTVRSFVIPNCIITIAIGGKDGTNTTSRAVIRFRFRKYPFSSYIIVPYMREGADDTYCSGVLGKGRTVQQIGTYLVNRGMDSAALKNHPPIGYDRNSMTFGQTGGPEVAPNAQWETLDPIKVYEEIGGDPSAILGISLQWVNLYAELTGVLPARIGRQTKSHTTATANQTELQRGASRTIDYVAQTGEGPLTRWLHMAYQMGRDSLTSNEKVELYIKDYGGFVELDKSMLPESEFEWMGSQGPQEEQQKDAKMFAATQQAVQLEILRRQAGMPPRLNFDAIQDELLRKGGWEHLAELITPQGAPGGPQAAPAVPGTAASNPGAETAALQGLNFGPGAGG